MQAAKAVPQGQAGRVAFELGRLETAEQKFAEVNRILSMPQYPFDRFIQIVEDLVLKIPDSSLKKRLPDQYVDFEDFDIIVSDILGSSDINALCENPTLIFEDFSKVVQDLVPYDIIPMIQDQYPLNVSYILNSMPEDTKATFAAIATMVRTNHHNNSLIGWIGSALTGNTWHGKASATSNAIKLCGVFERHKMFLKGPTFWAMINPFNEFTLLKSDDLSEVVRFRVDHIDRSRSGHSLRIWKDPTSIGERLTAPDIVTRDTWAQEEPFFAYSIPHFADMVPDIMLKEFKAALLSPDTYVLRAMLFHEVIKMKSSLQAMRDLFTIFSSAGLVHRFISESIVFEFTSTSINETTVLRSNSNLTCLFKVFYDLFGREFYQNVLSPIIDLVDNSGDIGLKQKSKESEPKISELLNKVLDLFLSGGKYISPQFRHMASILKSVTATMLRSRHSVFNALSSFLCLRFSNSIIADPSGYDPKRAPVKNMNTATIPFAQLLQLPFNLQPISDRYENLTELNLQIINRYEEIYNFVVGIANVDGPVQYPTQSDENVKAALISLLKIIAPGREAFISKYRDLYELDNDKSAACFAMSSFITHLFQC